jgi:hypothetical protein
MRRSRSPIAWFLSGTLLAGALVAMTAVAQTLPAPPSTTAAPAVAPIAPISRELAPFHARYAVFRDGKQMGDATLQLVSLEKARWRVDLRIEATRGLLGLAGLDLQQSTLFDLADTRYRPLTQSSVRKVLFGKRVVTGVYDWPQGSAHWTGDVKKTRRVPVALREGDMSGLLINLAVLRDAVPGAVLHYRFVDEGRARDQQYRVAVTREPQTVDDLAYDALRVDRLRASGEEATTFWVVEAVPTPIRILQRDDDGELLELRLIDYQEA